jgi:hypothetical protein
MKEEQSDSRDDYLEMGNAPEEIIVWDDTNSCVPEMTDEFREMVRKALTKKRPPENPPSPKAG